MSCHQPQAQSTHQTSTTLHHSQTKMSRALTTNFGPIPWEKAFANVVEFISLSKIEDFDSEEFPPRRSLPTTPSMDAHNKLLDGLKVTRQLIHAHSQDKGFLMEYAYSGADMVNATIRHYIFEVRRKHSLEDERLVAQYAKELEVAKERASLRLITSYLQTKRELKHFREDYRFAAELIKEARIQDFVQAREKLYRQIIIITVAECDLIWHPRATMYDGRVQGSIKHAPIEAFHLTKPPNGADGLYNLFLTWVPTPDATHRPMQMLIHRNLRGEYPCARMNWVTRGPLGNIGAVENSYLVRVVVMDDYVAREETKERTARERQDIALQKEKRTNSLWAKFFWRQRELEKMGITN